MHQTHSSSSAEHKNTTRPPQSKSETSSCTHAPNLVETENKVPNWANKKRLPALRRQAENHSGSNQSKMERTNGELIEKVNKPTDNVEINGQP